MAKAKEKDKPRKISKKPRNDEPKKISIKVKTVERKEFESPEEFWENMSPEYRARFSRYFLKIMNEPVFFYTKDDLKCPACQVSGFSKTYKSCKKTGLNYMKCISCTHTYKAIRKNGTMKSSH